MANTGIRPDIDIQSGSAAWQLLFTQGASFELSFFAAPTVNGEVLRYNGSAVVWTVPTDSYIGDIAAHTAGGNLDMNGSNISNGDDIAANTITVRDQGGDTNPWILEENGSDNLTINNNSLVWLSITTVGITAISNDLLLQPYDNTAGNTSELKFLELAANGTNYTSFKAGDSLIASDVYTLPIAYPGSNGEVMASTTTGILSWATIGSTINTATVAAGPYAVLTSDQLILCNGAAGAFTVNLPASATSSGRVLHIKKIDGSGNVITVDGNASETIDGATTAALTIQYESISIVCDGSNWHII